MAAWPNGDVLIADTFNHPVVTIDRAGRVQVVAGTGSSGFSGDGGPATGAPFAAPHSVANDATGRIVIGDTSNHRLREIRRDGTIATIAGDGGFAPAGNGAGARDASLDFRTGLMRPRPGGFLLPENSNRRVLEIR